MKTSVKESRTKDYIRDVLREYKAWWHMPVLIGLGSTCLDFRCYTTSGMPFEVEAKAPRKKPTRRQVGYAMTLLQLHVPVFLISEYEDLHLLKDFLSDMEAAKTWDDIFKVRTKYCTITHALWSAIQDQMAEDAEKEEKEEKEEKGEKEGEDANDG